MISSVRLKGGSKSIICVDARVRTTTVSQPAYHLRKIIFVLSKIDHLDAVSSRSHQPREHAEAEHMLEMTAMDPESAEFDTALEELIKVVNHHVEEEESRLPGMQQRLSEDRRAQLAEAFVTAAVWHGIGASVGYSSQRAPCRSVLGARGVFAELQVRPSDSRCPCTG
jgi:GTPase Era involved in 16S rRNA processing